MGNKVVVAILILLTAFMWAAFGWSTAGVAGLADPAAHSDAVLPATVGVLFLLAMFLLALTIWQVFALRLAPAVPTVTASSPTGSTGHPASTAP
jgi:hypothetical protein